MKTETEILNELRENRRGKGLYVEPTDEQILEIWERCIQKKSEKIPSGS